MGCSFRGLSWIKAANVVTAWACQTCGIVEARRKQNSPKHTWADTVSEVLVNPCFKKVDLRLIGHACGNRAKEKIPETPSVPHRTFWPRFVSERW